MTTVEEIGARLEVSGRRLRLGSALMALAGASLLLNGAVFFVRNVLRGGVFELGIGAERVGITFAELGELSTGLHHYVVHLHLGISAFLIGTGVGLAALGWIGVRGGLRWTWWTAVGMFTLIIALGLPAHFPWGFATLQHLGGVYVAIVLFVSGAILSVPVAGARGERVATET